MRGGLYYILYDDVFSVCFVVYFLILCLYEPSRHGTGKRWSKDGSTFEGNWLKDKPNGRGHTKFANGDE